MQIFWLSCIHYQITQLLYFKLMSSWFLYCWYSLHPFSTAVIQRSRCISVAHRLHRTAVYHSFASDVWALQMEEKPLILCRARCIERCQCPAIQREANEPFGKGSCLAHAVSYAETDMMQVLCIILAPMLLQQTEKCPPHSIIKLGVFFHNCCIVTNFNKMWIKILGWDVFLVWCKLCVNKLYLAHIINGWCTGLLSNTITNISMFSCLQCLQKAMDVPIFTKQCISDISKIYR